MYSVIMYRPSMSGRGRYTVQVNSLSALAKMIEDSADIRCRPNFEGSCVHSVKGLTNKERNILWDKCLSIEKKSNNVEKKYFRFNYIRSTFRREYRPK